LHAGAIPHQIIRGRGLIAETLVLGDEVLLLPQQVQMTTQVAGQRLDEANLAVAEVGADAVEVQGGEGLPTPPQRHADGILNIV